MSPKLALAFLLAASVTLAKGQNNLADSIRDSYHIFFPSAGKDILAAHIGEHYYKIVNVYDKPSQVYVDNRLVADAELSKYNDIVDRIKASVRDDDEEREMRQMERDRHQAERDARQEGHDREQARKDREQQTRDRVQEKFDREQQRSGQEQQRRDRDQQRRDQQQQRLEQQEQQRDREQQQRDREQTRRDQVQTRYDRVQVNEDRFGNDCRSCDVDREQSEQQQREQSAEDRVMLKKGIQVLVDEHVVNDPQHLKNLVLTDTDVSVNGIRQPQNIYQQMRSKLGDWASHGLSYGSDGSADNYSLSIND